MFELFLTFFQNLKDAAGGLLFILSVGVLMGVIGIAINCDNTVYDNKTFLVEIKKYPLKKLIALLSFLVLVTSVPSVDELWKTRIALIKFQLASPENVKASVEAIQDVAKKLECKYIGCDEQKSKAKKD